jgi:predicted nucleotidyltransferase
MLLQTVPSHPIINDGLETRFIEAWNVAFTVAKMLREKHHAEEVRITGSLLHRERFHEASDIDLAITNFSMANVLDIGPELDRYLPWKIDLIPLLSLYPEKRDYMLARSEPLGP